MQEERDRKRWLEIYIRHNYPQFSRYDIDLHLLNVGYRPDEIEAVWQLISSRQPSDLSAFSHTAIWKWLHLSKYLVLVAALLLLGISLLLIFRFPQNYWIFTFPVELVIILLLVNLLSFIVLLLWARSKGSITSRSVKGATWLTALAGLFFLLTIMSAIEDDFRHIDSASVEGQSYYLTSNLHGDNEFLVIFRCDTLGFSCKELTNVIRGKLDCFCQLKELRLMTQPQTYKLNVTFKGNVIYSYLITAGY